MFDVLPLHPPRASHPLSFLCFFRFFFFFFFLLFFFPRQTSKPDFNVRCSPPAPATHYLFYFFLHFFLFFFLCFFFHAKLRSQTSSSNFELRSWNFDLGSKFKLQTRSCNFEPRLQCSMFFPLLTPAPATHYLSYFFVFFLFLSFVFFSTPNFEARLQSSNFELRSWNFDLGSKFKLQTSKLQLRTQTSMFDVLPPPHPAPATHYLSYFFVFFLFSFSFFFFQPKLRSQTSKFQLRSWNFGSNFEVGTSKPDFNVPTSKFEVGTLKSGFKVQTWNL